jgi:hypothetical protein
MPGPSLIPNQQDAVNTLHLAIARRRKASRRVSTKALLLASAGRLETTPTSFGGDRDSDRYLLATAPFCVGAPLASRDATDASLSSSNEQQLPIKGSTAQPVSSHRRYSALHTRTATTSTVREADSPACVAWVHPRRRVRRTCHASHRRKRASLAHPRRVLRNHRYMTSLRRIAQTRSLRKPQLRATELLAHMTLWHRVRRFKRPSLRFKRSALPHSRQWRQAMPAFLALQGIGTRLLRSLSLSNRRTRSTQSGCPTYGAAVTLPLA